MTSSPWLEIPLEEYEAHMALPSVAQSPYLALTLGGWIGSLMPSTVAVLGCAGGTGFETIPPSSVHRVVGVDINASFLAAARNRHGGRFRVLELINGDILDHRCTFDPVAFIFAALILEYVDPAACMRKIRDLLTPGGRVGVILQEESKGHEPVTASPFPSLKTLAGSMTLVPPEQFKTLATEARFEVLMQRSITLETGKSFSEFLLGARTDAIR